MTLCWICSTSYVSSMLSPMFSCSMQKFVLSASPMQCPPFSSMSQLNISSSTIVMWPRIRFATALAPISAKLLFLNLRSLSDLFYRFKISHNFSAQRPSSWQSAMFKFSMLMLDSKIGSRIWKFLLPISFSLMSRDLIRSVFLNANVKCSIPRLS